MPKKHPTPREPATQADKVHQKRSDEEIAASLAAAYGCVSVAAQTLGMTPRAIYYRMEQNPDLVQAKDDAREALCDLAQLQLVRKINQGSTPEIIFTLKTLGRNRGFDERPVHEPPSVQVNLELSQALGELMRDPAARERARVIEADPDAGRPSPTRQPSLPQD